MGFYPENVVIVAGMNELKSSFGAVLFHCFSIIIHGSVNNTGNILHVLLSSCIFPFFYIFPFFVLLNRPKNVKQSKQCNLVGKAVQLIPNEEVNTVVSHIGR